MHRHDGERLTGGSARDEVAGAVGQRPGEPGHGPAQRGSGRRVVGPELPSAEARRSPGRGGHERCGHEDRRRVLRAARRDHEAQPQPDAGTHPGRDRTERGEQGVGRQQQRPVDDVRQSRRQRCEQEPVDRQVDQGEEVDRDAEVVVGRGRDHERDDDECDRCPQDVAHEQHLAPPPPVQEHARPRADDRERRQEDGEGDRDLTGRARPFGGEEEESGQADLEHAVRALAEQAHREQPPEPWAPQQDTELSRDAHRATPFPVLWPPRRQESALSVASSNR